MGEDLTTTQSMTLHLGQIRVQMSSNPPSSGHRLHIHNNYYEQAMQTKRTFLCAEHSLTRLGWALLQV